MDLSKFPKAAQTLFVKVYEDVRTRASAEVAYATAFETIKSKLRVVNGEFVANEADFITPVLYEFSLDNKDSELVFNEVDGEIVMDAVLADTTTFLNPRGEERFFTEEDLKELATQINAEGSTAPITDHNELKDLVMKHGSDYNLIKEALKSSRGILKNINAVVDGGKLWIRAVLDKRYKNHVSQFKGVSLEAFSTPMDNRLTRPKYLGWIFTNTPRMANAKITKVQ